MSETKGKAPVQSYEEVKAWAVRGAALALYFDISEEAQKAGVVDIFVIDVKEPLFEDATYQFYVVINEVACYASKTARGYIIEPDCQNPYFSQELNIRKRVLDKALRHLTGKSSYPKETQSQLIMELMEGNKTGAIMPVIRDVLPDVLTLGSEGAEIQAERQWSVQIGDHFCEVALFGTDDNGRPKLIILDE